jgi:hypothetical protein
MPSSKALATKQLAKAAQAARCQHIRFNNTRCGAPAQHDSQWCIFHAGDYEGHLPITGVPEDAATIQIELARVIRQLQNRDCDHKGAALTLYALQVASQNLRKLHAEFPIVEEGKFHTEPLLLVGQLMDRLDFPEERSEDVRRLCFDFAYALRGEKNPYFPPHPA